MEIANRNPDPETAQAMRDVNDVIAAKDYVDRLKAFHANPGRQAGKELKSGAVQKVFDHFQGVLDEAANKFATRFPSVDEVRHDPLGTGATLEDYRKHFYLARADLRKPDARRALFQVGAALISQGQPDAVFEARMREANAILAKMPGIGEYIRNFHEAQAAYALALATMHRDLEEFNKDLLGQPAEFVDELRRRSAALSKAQVVLEDTAQQVMPFAIFPPAEEAYFDLMQLADGFGSLGNGLSQLADTVENRKREYALTLDSIENESKRVTQGIEDIH